MSLFASLNGTRVIGARVTLPHWGAWHADVTCDGEIAVADSSTLVLGGWSLSCAPYRPAVAWHGRTVVRLIGGGGGWRTILAPYPYRNSTGVKLSLVLGDAAKGAGETIEVGTDRSLGQHYERERAPAYRLLNRLVPDAWWIDPDGVTRTGTRPSSLVGSPFTVIDVNGARGSYVIATETPGDILPGRRLRGTLPAEITIRGVTHTLGETSLRTEVLS